MNVDELLALENVFSYYLAFVFKRVVFILVFEYSRLLF